MIDLIEYIHFQKRSPLMCESKSAASRQFFRQIAMLYIAVKFAVEDEFKILL